MSNSLSKVQWEGLLFFWFVMIDLTKGNLSGHLSKLEKAGLVEINKSFVKKRPHTSISLTDVGKLTIENH